jgi:divalent metal cation (Fe/Co/Zn/Cd) transporter
MSATTHEHPLISADQRARLGRRAQLLAAASVSYNTVEAAVAISAGLVAGSGALVAFGLDSIIEVSSGLIILWQFRHAVPVSRERLALRLIAVSFFALATYVSIDAARALLSSHDPDASGVGIGLAMLSLLVMPWLSWAQRRTGRALSSSTVVADSTQTLLCTYLSGVLLAGLVLNAAFGWAWADPVVSLIIAAVAVREGLEAWRGDTCCTPAPDRHPTAPDPTSPDLGQASRLGLPIAGQSPASSGECADRCCT